MKRPENDKWLDDVLSETIGSKKPRTDFEQWKQKHPEAVQMLTSRSKSKTLTKQHPHKIRNIIMKSPITKLAAAAVIVIAVSIVVNQLDTSIDITTSAFAQITENMKQMPWLHVIAEGQGERLEAWFSFERRVMMQKTHDGRIICQDDLKRTVQVFKPDTNTVTISQSTTDSLTAMGPSALDFPKSILKLFDETSDKITQETGKYNGKDTKIYKIRGILGGMDMKVEMIVDRVENILLMLNQKVFDETGKIKIEAKGYFDYPENGPESIYDVGVPKTAKIVHAQKEKAAYVAFEKAITVIDAKENWPEPRDLAIAYWKARSTKNYDEMAIFWPGSATWNRKVIENEEPVEYVFGKVQSTDIEGHIIVPYASKSYYEKHGKYSLKMRLENKKSTKGRYYIVSGN